MGVPRAGEPCGWTREGLNILPRFKGIVTNAEKRKLWILAARRAGGYGDC